MFFTMYSTYNTWQLYNIQLNHIKRITARYVFFFCWPFYLVLQCYQSIINIYNEATSILYFKSKFMTNAYWIWACLLKTLNPWCGWQKPAASSSPFSPSVSSVINSSEANNKPQCTSALLSWQHQWKHAWAQVEFLVLCLANRIFLACAWPGGFVVCSKPV